ARSFDLSWATALPDGMRTRIHEGLRSTGASANCTGERAILSPATCFTPGCSGAGASLLTTDRGMDLLLASFMGEIGSQRAGGSAGSASNPNCAARCVTSTGLTASIEDGPPKSTIEATSNPA